MRESVANVAYAPRVNIQNDHRKAKAYQVRQVIAALDKLNAIEEGER